MVLEKYLNHKMLVSIFVAIVLAIIFWNAKLAFAGNVLHALNV